MALTKIDDRGLKTPIDLLDNEQIRFGTGNDLKIYHNGTDNYIMPSNGKLIINNGSETLAQFTSNGSVELYYDNAKKLETTSYGVLVNGNQKFDDNGKAKFGTGEDLQIYHNGSNSIIDSNTGNLEITSDSFYVNNAANNEVQIKAVANGAVELYNNNSKKLETSSEGVLIGNGGLHLGDNNKIEIGNGDDLEIYHDGSNSYIKNAGTGNIIFQSDDVLFKSDGGGNTGLTINTDGAVELYYNNSKKFETHSTGVQVTGDCLVSANIKVNDNQKLIAGSGNDLQLYHDGTHSYLDNVTGKFLVRGNVGTYHGNGIHIQALQDEEAIVCNPNGAASLYYDNDLKAQTYSSGFKTKNLIPIADNTYNMGINAIRWVKLYAASGSIGTSDKNEKNTIVESDLGLSFINKLKPVSYKWNNTNIDTATHYGLIAQDIEEAIESEGKTLQDFGAVEKPANASMGLNYSEFISPLIKAIQELTAKVAALEAK